MEDVTTRELTAVFAANLKSLRTQRGWSQSELARRIRVSPSAISQLESGANTPSLETLAALGTALGVAPDLLLRPEIFAATS